MYKVFSRFDRPQTPFSPVGQGTSPVFEERIEGGVLTLVKIGDQPLNDFIQEPLESTLIYNVLERFNAGDPYALRKNIGQFVDVTAMPRSLMEAEQMVINARNKFELLPLEIRAKFGHNHQRFMEEVASVPVGELGVWMDKLVGKKKEAVADVKASIPAPDQAHG